MTNTEPNPIELVRERLDGGRKWHKGSMGDGAGSLCVVGAVRRVMGLTEEQIALEHTIGGVAVEQYRERIPAEALLDRGSGIPSFNDHPDTTWADVETVLDKASIKWGEQVR